MRSLLTLASVLLLAAGTVGCQSSSDQGDENTPAVEEPTSAAPAPDEPATITHPVPAGFEHDTEGAAQYVLNYPSVNTLYRPLSEPSSTFRIYIVSYLLPAEFAEADYEQRAALVAEYDTVSGNTTAPSETAPALSSGYSGVYRGATVLDWWDEEVHQQNFFVFNGQLLAQVTCQWKGDVGNFMSACQEVVTGLEFETGAE